MALRRTAASGLRLLLRNQELNGATGWHVLSRELQIQASRQIFPACCSLLQPQDSQRAWNDGDRRVWFNTSANFPQSAQPALAQPTEEDQEENQRRERLQDDSPPSATGDSQHQPNTISKLGLISNTMHTKSLFPTFMKAVNSVLRARPSRRSIQCFSCFSCRNVKDCITELPPCVTHTTRLDFPPSPAQ